MSSDKVSEGNTDYNPFRRRASPHLGSIPSQDSSVVENSNAGLVPAFDLLNVSNSSGEKGEKQRLTEHYATKDALAESSVGQGHGVNADLPPPPYEPAKSSSEGTPSDGRASYAPHQRDWNGYYDQPGPVQDSKAWSTEKQVELEGQGGNYYACSQQDPMGSPSPKTSSSRSPQWQPRDGDRQNAPTPLNPPPPAFTRPIGMRVPSEDFPILRLLSSDTYLEHGFPLTPPNASRQMQMHPFAVHDVPEIDWTRFLRDLQYAAAPDPSANDALSNPLGPLGHLPIIGLASKIAMSVSNSVRTKKVTVQDLIGAWNDNFFRPRYMNVTLEHIRASSSSFRQRSNSSSSSSSSSSCSSAEFRRRYGSLGNAGNFDLSTREGRRAYKRIGKQTKRVERAEEHFERKQARRKERAERRQFRVERKHGRDGHGTGRLGGGRLGLMEQKPSHTSSHVSGSGSSERFALVISPYRV